MWFSYFRMGLADFLRDVWPIALSGGLLLAAICLFGRNRDKCHLSVAAPVVRLGQAAPFAVAWWLM